MLKLISEVDYCEDYDYVVDFDNYFEESGIPIFVFPKSQDNEFSFNKFKQDITKLFNNIPNLKYEFNSIIEDTGLSIISVCKVVFVIDDAE